MDDKQLLLILYLSFGILLTGLAIPLMKNKIKPNGLYGFRVAKTMENPEIWYAVNHHYSYRLFWSGITCILSAIVLYAIPGLSLDVYALGVLAVFMIVFLAGLWQSVRFMMSV